MKRMILLLISIALIVGVTGCGGAETIETNSVESSISESATVSDAEPVSPDAELSQASTPEPLI